MYGQNNGLMRVPADLSTMTVTERTEGHLNDASFLFEKSR